MAVIRHLRIKNFRGIKVLDWAPLPGINCLIGPGDSGKSTILDAIDLCLNPRRYAVVGEADFNGLDTSQPICIDLTLGALEDSLLDVDTYAGLLRGFDGASGKIEDEPSGTLEPVLTVRLEAKEDFVARWRLFAERTEARNELRDLLARDRMMLAPTRLGAYAAAHLAWGQRSVLNRIGEQRLDTGTALSRARSAAKQAFRTEAGTVFDEVLGLVGAVARDFAVSLGSDVKALIDTQQVSIGNGAIALHDSDNVPLKNMGTGSSRLLVAGLQYRAAPTSKIAIIDEIEHGLEPYRIAQLLHLLGSKAVHPTQLFLTTHSPVVLRELSATQVVVLRRPTTAEICHRALPVGDAEEQQKTLRACAEAFLTPRVLVCEGKTEVGLIRGFDLFWHDLGKPTLARCGVYAADGGGTEAATRALAFSALGYETALLRDDDVPLQSEQLAAMTSAGIRIFQWDGRKAFEAALFSSCPDAAIGELLDLAIATRGEDSIEADIRAATDGALSLEGCRSIPVEPRVRAALSVAATRKEKKGSPRNWFKLIEPSEHIGHKIIPTHWSGFDQKFCEVINAVGAWIRQGAVGDNAGS